MGFFNKSDRRRQLLPADLGGMLTEYGHYDFDASIAPMPSNDTITLLSRLQIDTEVRERSADAVAEIKGAAIGEGGWATYGAIALIDAFFPEQVGSATYEELYEKRLRYLHDLAVPRNSLNINDQTRWRQLFPGEL